MVVVGTQDAQHKKSAHIRGDLPTGGKLVVRNRTSGVMLHSEISSSPLSGSQLRGTILVHAVHVPATLGPKLRAENERQVNEETRECGESLIIYNMIGVQSREVTDHSLNSVDVLSYHWAIL